MFIRELEKLTGVSARTIRYYESIGLLPEPGRAENNYRQYTPQAIERLRFIVSARGLGFTLADIGDFLSARDAGALPCRRVLESFNQRLLDIDRRIEDLLALRVTLTRIQREAADLPANKQCDEQCVCDLASYTKALI